MIGIWGHSIHGGYYFESLDKRVYFNGSRREVKKFMKVNYVFRAIREDHWRGTV